MMLGRLFLIVCGLIGCIFTSQVPSVALQYQQRLGGTIEALGAVIAQFDTDATRNGLDRINALLSYKNAEDDFLKDRGVAMERAIVRYEELLAQKQALDGVDAVMQPLHVASMADQDVMVGVLEDYSFAPPFDLVGVFYAIAGLFGGLSISGLLRSLGRLMLSRRRRMAV